MSDQDHAGTNIWCSVHVDDLSVLFALILTKALAERESGVWSSDPFERYYFGSVETYRWGDLARSLAPILHKLVPDLIKSPVAVSKDSKRVPKAVGTNSRSVSLRSFKDGWVPKAKSLEECLEEDAIATLKKFGHLPAHD